MPEHKRYYWLQLQEGFFSQKEIKKLRKIAGGDTFTIIYLKMLIRSMNDDGKLYYEGYESDFPSELALDIDEDVENVKVTVQYLLSNRILIQCTESEYAILTAKEMIGSETGSARRMRRMRNTKTLQLTQTKPETSQCDTDVTQSDAAVTLSDAPVTSCDADVRSCDTDIYIDTDTDKERDEYTNKDTDTKKRNKSTFVPPTVEEIAEYIKEKGYIVNPEMFYEYYESNGWRIGTTNKKMKDWKRSVLTWEHNARDYEKQNNTHSKTQTTSNQGINKNEPPRRIGNGTVIS